MKTRPIIFSAKSVRAILAGRKTMTRRVVRDQGAISDVCGGGVELSVWWPIRHGGEWCPCPFGAPGDQLWVRETWWQAERPGGGIGVPFVYYDAEQRGGSDLLGASREWDESTAPGRWGRRPSIYMPRWASRLTLEVAVVHVERLQDIGEVDVIREGVERSVCARDGMVYAGNGSWTDDRNPNWADLNAVHGMYGLRGSFACAWDRLNAKRGFGWSADPWVWAITFVVKP